MDLGDQSLVSGSIWAAIGAVATKAIDWAFGARKNRLDDAAEIRRELREEVVRLNLQISALHQELDRWREKYFVLMETHSALKAETAMLRAEVARVTDRALPDASSTPDSSPYSPPA